MWGIGGGVWAREGGEAAPRVVRPGATDDAPPSDAVVLFDGRDLSKWEHVGGGAAKWKVRDGQMIVVPGTGDIVTRQSYGSCQLHIEWMVPHEQGGSGQHVGNSGIKFQTQYEIQVLESHDHTTRPEGQAGAIYAQHPPLVNACRPPNVWQSYDIVFLAPKRDGSGKVVEPGRFTVFQNGVLIHHNAKILGKTGGAPPPRYHDHAPRMPLLLQDHGHAVRYRNIWLRQLGA